MSDILPFHIDVFSSSSPEPDSKYLKFPDTPLLQDTVSLDESICPHHLVSIQKKGAVLKIIIILYLLLIILHRI